MSDEQTAVFNMAEIADIEGPLGYWAGVGQSNVGHSVSAGTNTLAGALHPYHCLTFKERGGIGATEVFNPAAFNDLGPAASTRKYGISPLTAALFAREFFHRENWGGPSPGAMSFATSNPARPITTIMPGSQNYLNAMQAAERAKVLAAKYNRSLRVRGMVFIQGETWSSDYAAHLPLAIDGYRAGLAQVFGQDAWPDALVLQINGSDTAASAGANQLAHYTFCRERYGQGVHFVTPMYHAKFAVGDVIHQDSVGIMMRGEYIALVMEAVVEGALWVPFWPVLESPVTAVSDTEFDIKLTRPVAWDPGLGQGGWVKAAPRRGFGYAGADSAGVAVISEDIVGPDTVRVRLSAKPRAADRRITYARGFVDTVPDRWTNTRGQLISSTGRTSPFWKLGQPVPEKINLYCAAFEEAIP